MDALHTQVATLRPADTPPPPIPRRPPCAPLRPPASPVRTVSVWVRKDQTHVKHGASSRNPTQLSDNVRRHYNLLIERTCTPATNGSMALQLAVPSAEYKQPRKASVSRLVERVTSSNSSSREQESRPRHAAPAIPIPKSASLSTQLCLAVKREGDIDFLGVVTFHLWELTHTSTRKLELPLRQYLLSEEVESDETGHFRARRHSWAGLVHSEPRKVNRPQLGLHEKRPHSPSNMALPREVARRKRCHSVTFVEEASDEEIVPEPDSPTRGIRQPPARRKMKKRESLKSMKSQDSDTSWSVSPGLIGLSLSTREVSRRAGGVLGIAEILPSTLSSSIRRAFDVPYDTNRVVGKAPDPLLQAAYNFWGSSEALIPQRVSVEGVLLFEDLWEQNADFIKPPPAAGGLQGGHSGWNSSFSSQTSSFEWFRDPQFGTLRSRGMGVGFHPQPARATHDDNILDLRRGEFPERERRARATTSIDPHVDQDLLMYKIKNWDETQVEPDFENTWHTLPGDRMYKLQHERANRPESSLASSPQQARAGGVESPRLSPGQRSRLQNSRTAV